MTRLSAIVSLVAVLGTVSVAQAQDADVLSGFAANNKDPIQIEADRLTILDKDKKAEFAGKVNVVQGDMTMTAERLIVFYSASAMDGAAGKSGKKSKTKAEPVAAVETPAEPEAGKTEKPKDGKTQPQITRIEADGGITVRQRDQVAKGDKAVYEAATQIVRLSGNVLLTQGKNVLRGDTLVVNLATRESKIESAGKSENTGRVTFIGTPSDKKGDKDKDGKKN